MASPLAPEAEGSNRSRGRDAEEAAAGWLTKQGYRVIERNVAFRNGEIDLIAKEGETLCFIEIKARFTDRFGKAVAGVTPRKQRQIVRLARQWLALHPTDDPCRFDVVGIDLGREGSRYTLVRNAFQSA